MRGQAARCSDDGEKTVHADAHQQEDAAVHGRLLEAWQDFAEDVAEDPSRVSINGEEREGEAEKEVGYCQVHQVDVCAASSFLHTVDHIDNHTVTKGAEGKDCHVGDHQAHSA